MKANLTRGNSITENYNPIEDTLHVVIEDLLMGRFKGSGGTVLLKRPIPKYPIGGFRIEEWNEFNIK